MVYHICGMELPHMQYSIPHMSYTKFFFFWILTTKTIPKIQKYNLILPSKRIFLKFNLEIWFPKIIVNTPILYHICSILYHKCGTVWNHICGIVYHICGILYHKCGIVIFYTPFFWIQPHEKKVVKNIKWIQKKKV